MGHHLLFLSVAHRQAVKAGREWQPFPCLQKRWFGGLSKPCPAKVGLEFTGMLLSCTACGRASTNAAQIVGLSLRS